MFELSSTELKEYIWDGWREEELGRTLEVAVEPFGLPGADVAGPPPRVGVARRPLQHPPPESSSAGLAALPAQDQSTGLKLEGQQCPLPTFALEYISSPEEK